MISLKEYQNKKIGYIYIGIFANNTYYQFKDKLDELYSEWEELQL